MPFSVSTIEAAELDKFGITTYSELRRHIHTHPDTCLYGLFTKVSSAFNHTAV